MHPKKKVKKKRAVFYQRLYRNIFLALLVILISLSIGVLGYHYIAHLSFIDAIQNASMILTGMGPIDIMPDNSSKLFASMYALFSGITFLSSIAILFAPMIERLMHEMNLQTMKEEEDQEEQEKPGR